MITVTGINHGGIDLQPPAIEIAATAAMDTLRQSLTRPARYSLPGRVGLTL
jgi:hypothetical protein